MSKYIRTFQNKDEYTEFINTSAEDSVVMSLVGSEYPLERDESNDITISCSGKVKIIIQENIALDVVIFRSADNDFVYEGTQYYAYNMNGYGSVILGLTRNSGENYTDTDALFVDEGEYTNRTVEVSFTDSCTYYAYTTDSIPEYILAFLNDYSEGGTYEYQSLYIIYSGQIMLEEVVTLVVTKAGTDVYIEPHVSLCLEENTVQYNKERIKPLKLSSPDVCTFSRREGLPYNTQCSFDGKTWFDYTNDDDPITFGNGVNLYIKGKNSSISYKIGSDRVLVSPFIIEGTNIKVSGSPTSLTNSNGYVIDCKNCGVQALFQNCTGIVNASEMKFYAISPSNYSYMFYGCTSLVNAPSILPATTLVYSGYKDMFAGCTSLVNAPELPATELAEACYENMFASCTSLVTAPALPATELASGCYDNMFSGCTSLVNAPALPSTELAYFCYDGMFAGCTSLVNAPELPATTLADWCYYGMFRDCTSLVDAPALPATTLANDCYRDMFSNCTSLVNAPELPAMELTSECYEKMFDGCTSLVNAPELPATILSDMPYQYMFNGCTSLVNAPSILPATSLTTCCYEGMFSGCTSLVNAPVLPATTLANWCYWYMFFECSSLKYIKMMATDISASGCLNDWTTRVSSTGTFECATGMTSSFSRGSSGIPGGWTVVEVAS